MTGDRRLAEAIAAHQQGRLDDAAALYGAILAQAPDHPEALHLSGVLALQRGDAQGAVEQIGRAIARRDDIADYHANIAEAYRTLGRAADAVAHCRRAVALAPEHAGAHNNLGLALREAGDLAAAEAAFRQVLVLSPGHARALNNLGIVLRQAGRPADAARILEEAVASAPDYADAHSNLGNALWGLDRRDEALACYRRALALDPDNAEALLSLGTALSESGEGEAAIACYRRAIDCRPDFADAYYNLANSLAETGDVAAAHSAYLEAIRLAPGNVAAQANLARLDLLDGHFADGFDRWTWRWREPETWRRDLAQPEWDGTPLDGRGIAVWAEQGAGDEIMLASVLPDLVAEAGRVVVECDARLVPLFARSFPDVAFVARAEPPAAALSAADLPVQCALGDVCRWRRRTAEAFAAPRAFLRADAGHVSAARARLDRLGPGPKIGIAWRSKARGGVASQRFSASKSTGLDQWRPVLSAPGVHFVNIQYGDCAGELEGVRQRLGVVVHQDPEVDQMRDLDGFAAQVAALDLVVTTSNTGAHVAGALGVETWTMVPFVPDWRWQLGRADTLWYPRMRLYRQDSPGDWDGPVRAVAAALGAWLEEARDGSVAESDQASAVSGVRAPSDAP